MEALSRLMRRAIELGLLRGFWVGRDAVFQLEISHLMFADDTLVLCYVNMSQIRYLRCVLIWFQVVSGLKMNVGKSVLVPVREVPEIETFADILSCRTGSFPISYLGLPLGAPSRCVGIWDPVVDRFERRLAVAESCSVIFCEVVEVKSLSFIWCDGIKDGRRICFGEDVWCGDVPLALAFPQLYKIASDRQAMVVNCYYLDNRRLIWDVRFRRFFQDWEIEKAIRFLELLYRQRIMEEDSDCWSWVANSQGRFEMRSFFRCLSFDHRVRFPWKSVWRSKALLKVAFFVWTLVLGRILTHDNLRMRSQVVFNRCYMCLRDEESMDHLLIHCSLAR
ncbi:uncharacterized protein LOC132272921 [Cornus florida]|uniref:uncharacterized protein LOC132272921 n=1 Tax=Cornus florida TaxID=4283 RepID=UPI0028982C53|nr:uncharacterized protein LOC132272921 [Cornus florida]